MRKFLSYALLAFALYTLARNHGYIEGGGGGVAPIPAEGFRVLIIEETGDRYKLSPGQLEALNSTLARDYMNSRCAKGVDGKTPEWRIWDDDFTAQDLSRESKLWQDAYARPDGPLPWIVVSNGKSGTEQELPKSEADLINLLKQYGG